MRIPRRSYGWLEPWIFSRNRGGDRKKMMSSHQQQKSFTCFNCQQEIKLKRSEDNSKWLRLNLDGVTTHSCQKKQQQQKQQPALQQPVVSSLERKIDTLIAEVQALRLELQKKK